MLTIIHNHKSLKYHCDKYIVKCEEENLLLHSYIFRMVYN